jgi:hypothetical protein
MIALVRLRGTGAGLACGAAFGLLAVLRLGYRLFRSIILPGQMQDGALSRMFAAGIIVDLASIVALVILAVGLLLLPAALARKTA